MKSSQSPNQSSKRKESKPNRNSIAMNSLHVSCGYAYKVVALMMNTPSMASNAMPPHTCMLLTALYCKTFEITIFTWDLFEWRRSSFFCYLIEVVDFKGAANLSSVRRSLLSFKANKSNETRTLTSAVNEDFEQREFRDQR